MGARKNCKSYRICSRKGKGYKELRYKPVFRYEMQKKRTSIVLAISLGQIGRDQKKSSKLASAAISVNQTPRKWH